MCRSASLHRIGQTHSYSSRACLHGSRRVRFPTVDLSDWGESSVVLADERRIPARPGLSRTRLGIAGLLANGKWCIGESPCLNPRTYPHTCWEMPFAITISRRRTQNRWFMGLIPMTPRFQPQEVPPIHKPRGRKGAARRGGAMLSLVAPSFPPPEIKKEPPGSLMLAHPAGH